MEKLKETIINVIKNNPGIKATKLIVEVVEIAHHDSLLMQEFLDSDMPSLLEQMVLNKDIKEVEFEDHLRVKSIYFANDANVKIL